MSVFTAKVFQSGNSQAIRLPKALRFRAKTVQIEKTRRGLLILDPKEEAKRVLALAKLYGSCPEFPEVESLALTRRVRPRSASRGGRLAKLRLTRSF